jgi:hypothetical protein
MELMSGYGTSDSEDEGHTQSAAKPITVPKKSVANVYAGQSSSSSATSMTGKPNAASSSTHDGGKTKKLNISILPPEIQFALQHGGSLSDSDDDNDDLVSNFKKSQASSAVNKPPPPARKPDAGTASSKTGLMALLPKPTQAPEAPTASYIMPVQSTKSAGVKPPTTFSFDTTTTTTTVSKKLKSEPPKMSYDELVSKYTPEEANDSDSNDAVDGTDETMELTSTPLFTFSSSTRSRPVASADTGAVSPTTQDNYESAYGPAAPIKVAPVVPSESQIQQPVSHEQSVGYYENYNVADSSQPSSSSWQSTANLSNSQKRKRERDIEQALLAGDLSVVDNLNGPIEVVASTVPDRWDAGAYHSEKATDAKIAALSSSVGLKHGISKNQSRKHQINTLAVQVCKLIFTWHGCETPLNIVFLQAAKMELQLLEAKGAKNVTKMETQRKYGW